MSGVSKAWALLTRFGAVCAHKRLPRDSGRLGFVDLIAVLVIHEFLPLFAICSAALATARLIRP